MTRISPTDITPLDHEAEARAEILRQLDENREAFLAAQQRAREVGIPDKEMADLTKQFGSVNEAITAALQDLRKEQERVGSRVEAYEGLKGMPDVYDAEAHAADQKLHEKLGAHVQEIHARVAKMNEAFQSVAPERRSRESRELLAKVFTRDMTEALFGPLETIDLEKLLHELTPDADIDGLVGDAMNNPESFHAEVPPEGQAELKSIEDTQDFRPSQEVSQREHALQQGLWAGIFTGETDPRYKKAQQQIAADKLQEKKTQQTKALQHLVEKCSILNALNTQIKSGALTETDAIKKVLKSVQDSAFDFDAIQLTQQQADALYALPAGVTIGVLERNGIQNKEGLVQQIRENKDAARRQLEARKEREAKERRDALKELEAKEKREATRPEREARVADFEKQLSAYDGLSGISQYNTPNPDSSYGLQEFVRNMNDIKKELLALSRKQEHYTNVMKTFGIFSRKFPTKDVSDIPGNFSKKQVQEFLVEIKNKKAALKQQATDLSNEYDIKAAELRQTIARARVVADKFQGGANPIQNDMDRGPQMAQLAQRVFDLKEACGNEFGSSGPWYEHLQWVAREVRDLEGDIIQAAK